MLQSSFIFEWVVSSFFTIARNLNGHDWITMMTIFLSLSSVLDWWIAVADTSSSLTTTLHLFLSIVSILDWIKQFLIVFLKLNRDIVLSLMSSPYRCQWIRIIHLQSRASRLLRRLLILLNVLMSFGKWIIFKEKSIRVKLMRIVEDTRGLLLMLFRLFGLNILIDLGFKVLLRSLYIHVYGIQSSITLNRGRSILKQSLLLLY